MKRVAILGGGPAGAYAAERLATAGLETVVYDEKLAWEKPCGGGLTYKAYSRYPFLIQNDTPKNLIHETTLAGPKSSGCTIRLSQPLVIYSRFDLNRMLLERAERAGAQVEKTRVTRLERNCTGWNIDTKDGRSHADYCIVATGARNPLRSVGTRWSAGDTMCALGYYIPSSQSHVDIQFLPDFEGYIWIFPRCGHLSAGICGKGEPAATLRRRLERFLGERGISWRGGQFYAHMLPSLAPGAWRDNRVAGEGWMAVGDAGGLVDPITGEGIYYAVRSADIAAEVLVRDECRPAEAHSIYRRWLEEDFVEDLAFGARFARRLFRGHFLFRSVPDRMLQFMRRSPRFVDLIEDLFAGTQPYLGLRGRLMDNVNGTFFEVMSNLFFRHLLPHGAPVFAGDCVAKSGKFGEWRVPMNTVPRP